MAAGHPPGSEPSGGWQGGGHCPP